ncbi:MAG: hypothetical protein SFZ24_11980 [Planctomycetota bacterium]|nr:hypothetical protein [Planctomycetota bacterium]
MSARSSITLRALEGRPLLDPAARDMVIAMAHAIAERNGVGLSGLATSDDSITVELEGTRLMALGFAAELRRLTDAWYSRKFGETSLWGEPRTGDAAEDGWQPWDWDA